MFSNFESANKSLNRGYIYYPEIKSERSVDTYTRAELMKKSSWAFDNIGFVKGLLLQLANLNSKLMPKSATSDDEWNKKADEAFRRVTGDAEMFDVAGKLDWRGWVKAVFLGTYRLGDCATGLVKGEDGGAMLQFYESYSITSKSDEDGFTQGLRLDDYGKVLSFSIQVDDETFVEVGRENMLFAWQYEKPGQVR